MLVLAFIAAAALLLAFLALVALVLGIHATERRFGLRQPSYGRIDTFTRRLLGVYADHPRCETKSAAYDHTRR